MWGRLLVTQVSSGAFQSLPNADGSLSGQSAPGTAAGTHSCVIRGELYGAYDQGRAE